jgi:hypothetical protein
VNHVEGRRCEELFATQEEVITFAQAYFATEFPNGERRDCLPPDELKVAAESGVLPSAELLEHVFRCSDCFRSYRGAKLARLSHIPAKGSWWANFRVSLASFTSRPAAPMAATLCLAIVGLLTTLLILNARRAPLGSSTIATKVEDLKIAMSPTASQTHMDVVSEVERGETKPPQQDIASARKNSQTRRPKLGNSRAALPLVDINLREETLLRSVEEAVSPPSVINLSRRRQRVRLRMPAGSGSGRYTVTVVDAFGRRLVGSTGRSNGRTLTVDLDLSGLDKKKYRMCLERDGEAPDCYQVVVD